VAQQIDGEVQRIVNEAHEMALRMLNQNRERLERVAGTLMEIETLDQEEFEKVWNGEELAKLDNPGGTPPAAPKPSKPAPEAPTPSGNKPNPAPLPA
jgi:cell division protease FtsH